MVPDNNLSTKVWCFVLMTEYQLILLEALQRPSPARVTLSHRNEDEGWKKTMTGNFQLTNHADVQGAGVSALRKLEKQI